MDDKQLKERLEEQEEELNYFHFMMWLQSMSIFINNLLDSLFRKPQQQIARVDIDKEYYMAACKCREDALKNAPFQYRNDPELGLVAVKHFGTSIQYLSKNLQKDFHIAHTAVSNDWKAYEYLPEQTKLDSRIKARASETLSHDIKPRATTNTYMQENNFKPQLGGKRHDFNRSN